MKTLVILGTARDDSNTTRMLDRDARLKGAPRIELHRLNLAHYTYSPEKPQDDFLGIVDQMLGAEHIVFATPVYWYAMSGVMKIFFDRLSDLISVSKPRGRALAGKTTELFSTGSDPELPEGFEVPFRRTSEYFDMRYSGAHYHCVTDSET